MIRFYSEVTGAPYPYSGYSQVFVQDVPWGFGANTLAVQSENMIDDDRIHAEYFYLWDGLEAETLAQQWFGNFLAPRDWAHVWLNRGFAHYFDGLYNEHKLTVKQTQKIDPDNEYPQVEFFRGKVEVEIDSRVESVWLLPQAKNVFVFGAETQPRLVNFDYESTWIKELKFEKSLDELLYQLENDRDVLGKRWAMNELVKIAKDESTSATEKARVLAGFRQSILGKEYWRLRQSALGLMQSLLLPAAAPGPVKLDEATIAMLLTVIKNQKSWNRAAAINFLGMTGDQRYADLYLSFFNDESDRVINAAAIAFGRSKSPRAFDALAKLVDKPSWKNQSLISALAGLKQLGDPRGFDIAFKALADTKLHRWRLPVPPVWDLRVFAVDTIASLGKSHAAYPLLLERFRKSMAEDDLSGIFNNVELINKLADPRGREIFELMKTKFKDDANLMSSVTQYEAQFLEAIKK